MITSIEQLRKKDLGLGKVRTYGEIVDYLDALKPFDYSEASLRRMKDLDTCFDGICSKIDTVVVGGTNGKSTAMHFAAKLLQEEGLKVGLGYSTHLLTYNERLVLNNDQVANKAFADLLNEVINAVEFWCCAGH